MKVENTLKIILIIFLLFSLIFILTATWDYFAETYTTNKITECNDNDGDLIEGLTCYETIECADVFKFLNLNGCEEFIK